MQCDLNPFLRATDNYHLCVLIIAFALALSAKNRNWVILTGITTFFYYIGFSTACDVRLFDTNGVWRHVIWVLWNVLYMAVIYTAWTKKLIYQYQAGGAIFLSLCGDLLQVFRFIDYHYFELVHSTNIYQTMAPALNNLLVLVCLYPLITYIKKGASQWK
ncbi:MAG: hypothetical protein ACI8WB_000192 [Phenylobacterium sp.]